MDDPGKDAKLRGVQRESWTSLLMGSFGISVQTFKQFDHIIKSENHFHFTSSKGHNQEHRRLLQSVSYCIGSVTLTSFFCRQDQVLPIRQNKAKLKYVSRMLVPILPIDASCLPDHGSTMCRSVSSSWRHRQSKRFASPRFLGDRRRMMLVMFGSNSEDIGMPWPKPMILVHKARWCIHTTYLWISLLFFT